MAEPETRRIQDIIVENQESINSKTLMQIATTDPNSVLVDDLMSRDIPTQLRAFMLAKAQGDLVRIYKIDEALRSLEDSFIERAMNDKDDASMKNLIQWMDTMKSSEDRAINSVNKVMGDQNINMIIDQSTKIYNDNSTTNNTQNNTANFVSVLSDKNSRQKIRDIASRLTSSISVNTAEIVDSPISNMEEQSDE